MRVDRHLDGLADDDAAQVGLGDEDLDPQVIGQEHAHDRLAGRDEVALAHRDDVDEGLARARDDGLGEVDLDLAEPGAGLLGLGLHHGDVLGPRAGLEEVEVGAGLVEQRRGLGDFLGPVPPHDEVVVRPHARRPARARSKSARAMSTWDWVVLLRRNSAS